MDQSELNTLEGKGFVVIRGAVGSTLVDAALEALERRRAVLTAIEPEAIDQAMQSGFFPMWNASALWRIRELSSLREPFEIIYGTKNLWVSLDRCGYRPAGSDHRGSLKLHWDDDCSRWDFAKVQGVVALSTAERCEGCFVCAPSLYRTYRERGRYVADQLLQGGAVDTLDIELRPGDLLLFDYRLAHGTAVHRGPRVRAVQYLAFVPAGGVAERLRRLQCWETGVWRGRASSQAYRVPDEQAPPLTEAGWRALARVDHD